MVKAGGAELRLAMIKAAALTLPQVPGFGDTKGTKSPTKNLVPRQPAPAPELERTRPEAVAPQKTIAPPAI
jgi:hypothetical protein